MTSLTEYQNLIMDHAELRSLRVRLNAGGILPDSEVDRLANGIITSAMQEADDARTLTSRQIETLAPGLRYSIAQLTAMPQESHTDARARARTAAHRLRRMIDGEA